MDNVDYRVEAYDGQYFWYSKKNNIYKNKFINKVDFVELYITVSNKYIKYFFPIINRLLRTGIHNILPTKYGCIVVSKGKLLIYRDTTLDKVIEIPRGSRPLRNGIIVKENILFFGDYWGNKEREAANVYRVDLNTYKIEVILSLKSRHIHFVTFAKEMNLLIIGTGDEDIESKMLFFNYETKEQKIIGQGSQKYRAVSVIQQGDFLIWGTDAPDEQNYIYSYNCKTEELKMLQKISGPAYYSTVTSNGEMYIGTTIEDKARHKAILYKSNNMYDWNEVKEFKKDFLDEKYFGYGLIEFMHGQDQVEKLHYNLVNLYEA